MTRINRTSHKESQRLIAGRGISHQMLFMVTSLSKSNHSWNSAQTRSLIKRKNSGLHLKMILGQILMFYMMRLTMSQWYLMRMKLISIFIQICRSTHMNQTFTMSLSSPLYQEWTSATSRNNLTSFMEVAQTISETTFKVITHRAYHFTLKTWALNKNFKNKSISQK